MEKPAIKPVKRINGLVRENFKEDTTPIESFCANGTFCDILRARM